MRNESNFIVASCIVLSTLFSLASFADAQTIHIKNINIPSDECHINFYRDPLPERGIPRYAMRVDSYFRAPTLRFELSAIDKIKKQPVEKAWYQAVALVCGSVITACNANPKDEGHLPVRIDEKSASMVITAENVGRSMNYKTGYACTVGNDSVPAKSIAKPDEPTIFLNSLPSTTDDESDKKTDRAKKDAMDKDYFHIKQVVKNLDNGHAALVTKSIYDRITSVTKRSDFKYYGPNILHCLFSTAVAAGGVVAMACTLGTAAPIVVPAIIGGVSSVASTGSYDIAKRQMEKENNDYQDGIADMKQMYRNMAYYAANVLIKTVGNTNLWHIDVKERAVINSFIAQAFTIAIRNNFHLRLSVEDTIEILTPILYLHKLSGFDSFTSTTLKDKLETLAKEDDVFNQKELLQGIFKALDAIDDTINKYAQDEGLKISLRTGLNSLRFKFVEQHVSELYLQINRQNTNAKCMYETILHAINKSNESGAQKKLDVAATINGCIRF